LTCLDCSRSIIDDGGIIHSPQYPSQYVPNKDCIYTLIANSVLSSIELTFETFDLEDSSGCKNDYIEIYDGSSSQAPKMYLDTAIDGRFCGANKPPVTLSSGRTLTIRFHSNKNISGDGFSVSWKKTDVKLSMLSFYLSVAIFY